MKAVLWSSVLLLSLAAVAHAGHGKHGGYGKARQCRGRGHGSAGHPGVPAPRDGTCRDIQRSVQDAVNELGDDARNRGRVMKTVNRALGNVRGTGLKDCLGCIGEQFARGVGVGEQRPCGQHDPCVTGDALNPAADRCAAQVCDVRKSCCRKRWDEVCVGIAGNVCEHACESCPHGECVEGRALTCDCTGCSLLVCRRDPYCCDTSWDARCVESATAACALTCGAEASSTTTTTTTTTTSTTSTTVPECTTSADCADVDACTVETCSSGHCSSAVRTCDDQDACTVDSCDSATGCVFAPVVCNDSNPCTDDRCSAGACTYTPNADFCNDNNPCTLSDQCAAGACAGTPRVCNDNRLCTTDFCDNAGVCRSSNNTVGCDDANPCTIGDRCSLGNCIGGPVLNCNDNDRCTTDFCDTTGTCRHTTPGCSDGNACTIDFCDPALGCGHQTASCDDGDPCTTDTCSTITGCRHVRVVGCVP